MDFVVKYVILEISRRVREMHIPYNVVVPLNERFVLKEVSRSDGGMPVQTSRRCAMFGGA